jgi:hypothetical protein
MKTSNVTVFKCDHCGHSTTCENYEDVPISWFSSMYRSDSVRLDVDGMTISVSFRDKHFCDSKCVCDYFTKTFLENLAARIEEVKTPDEEAA